MKVVVVGAGYAGTIAANRLAKNMPSAQVTVVNPRDEFVERIRLHQRIAGTGAAARPLRDMLHERVEIRLGEAEKIGDGVVRLAGGASVDFDYLVYAVGASEPGPQGVYTVGSPEQAARAAARLTELPRGAVVTVVGAGLTGIETASEVAGARPDLHVRLVGDELGASLGDRARARVSAVLGELGVEVERGMWDGDGDDLVLWAVASGVGGLAERSGLAVDDAGRVLVDASLRSVSDPRVFAAGDCASVPGSRMSCQAALPQGGHVGASLMRIAKGKQPKPFSMSFVGQNVSLGRHDGVIQVGRRDDSPTRFFYGRRPAAATKELVCRATVWSTRSGIAAVLPGPKK